MVGDVKLENRLSSRYKRNVEIKKIIQNCSDKIGKRILVKARDLYPNIYKSNKLFFGWYYLLKIIEGGYVISPCTYMNNHMKYIKYIYFYKDEND